MKLYDIVKGIFDKDEHIDYFSYSSKGIPDEGSPTYAVVVRDDGIFAKVLSIYGDGITSRMNKIRDVNVDNVVNHRNGDITIKTENGNMRFWKKGNYEKE